MEIKVVEKDGKKYFNGDLRKMDYNKPKKFVLLWDNPIEGKHKTYGDWAIFGFGTEDKKRISVFIGDGFKTEVKDQKLVDVLKGFSAGAVIKIEKKEGTFPSKDKEGNPVTRTYRYFVVERSEGLSIEFDDYKLPDEISEEECEALEKSLEEMKKEGKEKDLTDKQIAGSLNAHGFDSKKEYVDNLVKKVGRKEKDVMKHIFTEEKRLAGVK